MKNQVLYFGFVVFFFSGLFLFGVGFRANSYILGYWGDFIFDNIEDIEETEVGLVFGGGMIDENTMSPFQFDRVLKGVELYKKGKVKRLIMTGDDGTNRSNEVEVMKKMAVEAGVPKKDVSVDGKSYRTYLSCYRGDKLLDLDKVIVVSQKFHLARIRYFCEYFGISTVGYEADIQNYNDFYTTKVREFGARVKGWWQVEISKPQN